MAIQVLGPKAKAILRHERSVYDDATKSWQSVLLHEQEAGNIVTDAGRRQLHRYCYGAAGQRASLGGGFNYIAITNDATAPNAADVVLTGEIGTDGLGRQVGTVTLPTGSNNITVVSKLFTYTGAAPITLNKAALFDAASGGVMAHEILFGSSRTLFQNDTFSISFEITFA